MTKKIALIIAVLTFVSPCFAAEKAAEVTAAKGRVEVVHGDAVMGKRAKEGTELVVEDVLRTKRRGYAEVGFVDGTNVKVFEKSRLTINGLDRTETGINAEIQKGKVLFKVEKMEDVAGDFRVKTTNSIIGVKGTTFGIVSGGLLTIVEVYNGNVEVLTTVEAGADTAPIIEALKDSGKAGLGGDSLRSQGILSANLSSGQGAILSTSGEIQVYEFGDGGGESLIFSGSVDDLNIDEESDGSEGDEAAFSSIGTEEEEGSGGDDQDSEDYSGFDDLGDDPAADMEGYPGSDYSGEFREVGTGGDEPDDFYSSPDERPDTPEQQEMATGNVNIHIDFE